MEWGGRGGPPSRVLVREPRRWPGSLLTGMAAARQREEVRIEMRGP